MTDSPRRETQPTQYIYDIYIRFQSVCMKLVS